MDELLAQLAHLAPRAPRRLLDDLAQLSRSLAASGRSYPELQLYLVSGSVIHGRLVDVADDRGTVVATMLVSSGAHTMSVSFVRVDQIAAITVVDPALLVQPLVADLPAPGRLELQRLLAGCVEAIATAVGRQLHLQLPAELDHDDRWAIAMALPVLADVVIAIGHDAIGQEALAALDTIDLQAAAAAAVTRPDPRRLVVSAPKAPSELFTTATLRRELEKVL